MTSGQLLRDALRDQRRAVVAGAASGVVWMGGLALLPAVIGSAVDAGAVERDVAGLAGWLAVLAAVTAAHLVAGGARHWLACRLYYGTTAAVSSRVTSRLHDPRGGVEAAPATLVSLVTSDALRLGVVADLCCRGSGALVALLGVAGLMTASSPTLAAAVLVVLALVLPRQARP